MTMKKKPQLTPDQRMLLMVRKQLTNQLALLVGDGEDLPPLGPPETIDEALARVKRHCDEAMAWSPEDEQRKAVSDEAK